MEDNVAKDEHTENDQNAQISPILSRDNFARRNNCKRDQKAHVDQGCRNAADLRRTQDGGAAGEPQ